MRWMVLLVVVGCAASPPVPRDVGEAFRRESGGRAKRIEDRGGFYEAEWYVDGVAHEARVSRSGEVIEVEVVVAPGAVPPAVRAAAEHALGGKDIEYARLVRTKRYEAERRGREIVIDELGHIEDRDMIMCDGDGE